MINTVPSSNMVEVTLNNHVLSLWLTKDHGQVCHHGKNYTSMPIFQLELESWDCTDPYDTYYSNS